MKPERDPNSQLTAAELSVMGERHRQRHRWSDEHDDGHTNPNALQLAAAAISAYGHPGVLARMMDDAPDWVRLLVEKHGTRQRLVIASALLIAEIERIDRMERASVDDSCNGGLIPAATGDSGGPLN